MLRPARQPAKAACGFPSSRTIFGNVMRDPSARFAYLELRRQLFPTSPFADSLQIANPSEVTRLHIGSGLRTLNFWQQLTWLESRLKQQVTSHVPKRTQGDRLVGGLQMERGSVGLARRYSLR